MKIFRIVLPYIGFVTFVGVLIYLMFKGTTDRQWGIAILSGLILALGGTAFFSKEKISPP